MLLLHPQWSRSCEDCRRFMYDTNGKQHEKFGKPVRRPPGMPLPCGECPKTEGAEVRDWLHAEDGLSDRSAAAVAHYQRCRAVGRFPEDDLVEEHAAVIRAVEDAAETRAVTDRLDSLAQVLTLAVLGGGTGQRGRG